MRPKRLYDRYAFSASATITDSSGLGTSAQVTTISVGGCRLVTTERFAVGARITIKIQIGSDDFEAPANVVYCAEDGIGAMFHNESPRSLLVLAKWVQEAKEGIEV